jgi:hypothetical protein
MFRKKQPNRLKLFYYSHPYFVIFNVLIIYNVILIALAALLMTYLMKGITSDGFTWAFNLDCYWKNLEYCVVFTMNNGGIYNEAPISVIILKIVLSILQMITFTGALIGLATSILQSMFDHRIHNVGKIKIKHHYVILEWSAVGPNLVRELSFIKGNKTIVILSNKNRDEIQEEIDDLFLETGTEKKHLKIFVKNGNPSSRKALKEINIDKAESIAILGASSWLNASEQNDSISFKILMSVISLTKNANIVIETDDQDVTKNIHDLMQASSELRNAKISLFSRNTIVGHVLAKTAINADYPNLYYSLLSFRNGSFYAINKDYSVDEALSRYSSCLPAFRYKCDEDKEYLFVNAEKETDIRKNLLKKKRSSEAPFKKKIIKSSFTLYVIGKNERSEAIDYAVRQHNALDEGKVNLKILPTDCDINELLEEIASIQGKKKILILSDNNAQEENIDANVFLSLIKIKANKELSKDIEVFAEIFEPSNRFSLEALNISSVIIANQMVAVYMTQLLCHAESHKLYEDLLLPDSDAEVDFEIRQAKELLNIKENLEFSSRGDFIYALYNSSKQEYLPIGFIGEKKRLGLADAVTNVVSGAINVTGKVISGITNALTLSDTPEDAAVDFKDIMFLNKNLNKKEKIIIRPDTTMIVVHKK